MMPGETHPAAPGPADLARCQGCASLQQVRRIPGRPFCDVLGAGAGALFNHERQNWFSCCDAGGGQSERALQDSWSSRLRVCRAELGWWVTLSKRGGNLPLCDEGLLALLIICCLKARVLCFMLRAQVARLQDSGTAFQLTRIY